MLGQVQDAFPALCDYPYDSFCLSLFLSLSYTHTLTHTHTHTKRGLTVTIDKHDALQERS